MDYQQRESGLVVPISKPEPPPEHPVRQVIREALAALNERLCKFEHTCHATCGNGSIESATKALNRCFNEPTAYTISDLSQLLDQFQAAHPSPTLKGN